MGRKISLNSIFILFVFFVISTSGCGKKVYVRTLPPERHFKKGVAKTGYSIQAGAFSQLENAIRLTMSLKDRGIAAYYFKHSSGLYKVRFGDFSTKREAVQKASEIQLTGIISGFYIVSPGDYAASEKKSLSESRFRDELVKTAETFLGMPYRWGSSSFDKGFDCSGLTMAVYHLNGLSLPRTSSGQYGRGMPVKKRDLKKGDLVFFATGADKKVSHVGIYIGKDSFIHAPGKDKDIREDRISNTYFSKRYVGARSYI